MRQTACLVSNPNMVDIMCTAVVRAYDLKTAQYDEHIEVYQHHQGSENNRCEIKTVQNQKQ